MSEAVLRVSEIFTSIQGESSRVGLPTTFVRLTGCPLRCHWCDTAYAFQGGLRQTVSEVVAEVRARGVRTVCVTGGEPLAQPAVHQLLRALADAGYDVSLETSGALPIADVDPRVAVVMDLKAPGSGEHEKNLWQNLVALKPTDEIKIVIADRADYEWAKMVIAEHRLTERCAVLLSPVANALPPHQLAEWIVADKLPVRFQLQLHKVLWGEERGR
ncbi:7-carboxy-7-deazaguanine synthase QueE [Hydrogenophilus hirschii]|nr:7-carboxy-7-deazaguanine synthase QueE [Hydrogenophilus thermoluteolus]